jgi:biotin carboxyl carrier protein
VSQLAQSFASIMTSALIAVAIFCGSLQSLYGQTQDFSFDLDSTAKNESKKSQSQSNVIDLNLCFVMLIYDIDVPARESGVLKNVNFREGAYVEANAEIAKINDLLAQRQLAEAQARKSIAGKKASDNVEKEFAELAYQHWYEKFQKERKLVQKGAGSPALLNDYLFEAKKARKSIERAKADQALGNLDVKREEVLVKASEDFVERHVIRSKINGNVFEIYKQAGEFVKAGDSILRIVQMDRLRVQGFIDATSYDRHQVAGQRVTVTANMAGGREVQFEGKVSYVGLDEHAGDRFMVWAEVDNRSENGQWLLVPNDEVKMQIHLNTRTAKLPSITPAPDKKNVDANSFKNAASDFRKLGQK